jgi:hypothetical protein
MEIEAAVCVPPVCTSLPVPWKPMFSWDDTRVDCTVRLPADRL